MKFFRRLIRQQMRKRLEKAYRHGRRMAHYPPFLDRVPLKYKNAEISAFTRGFAAEKKVIHINKIRDHMSKMQPPDPAMFEPNSEWDG